MEKRQSSRRGWILAVLATCWAAPGLLSHATAQDSGSAGGSSMLGPPLGAAQFPDDSGSPSGGLLSGRAGSRGTHVPAGNLAMPGAPSSRPKNMQANFQISSLGPAAVPAYGNLDLVSDTGVVGPENGMSLTAAIDLLVRNNLALLAMRLEIPMAEADVLTASLRVNPVFYADQQLVPYGHFSFLRPGGPQQTDINISYPLDVTHKRRARTESATRGLQVAQQQLKDAVRNQIDNLYTVYVDAVQASLSLQYSKTYLKGIEEVLVRREQLFEAGQESEDNILQLRQQRNLGLIQVRESTQASYKAQQALALMLNIPLRDFDTIQVRDAYRDFRELPMSRDELVQRALRSRADMAATRLSISRAEADIKLAKANRYPDVYVLYQPYTLQNNTYLGVQSAYSWTLGLTATIPVYNRNQGNIRRAEINLNQSHLQLKDKERSVTVEVIEAVREYEQSRLAAIEIRDTILPPAQRLRNIIETRYNAQSIGPIELLNARKDFNEVVRSYRDALIRHRRAMLDLNTAIGERIMP
jgi:outer membrane protein, heavy metal efflux system